MKKNIIIGILSVVTCLSLVFAYQQHDQKKELQNQITKAEEVAKKNFEIATEHYERLKKETEIARAKIAQKESEKLDESNN